MTCLLVVYLRSISEEILKSPQKRDLALTLATVVSLKLVAKNAVVVLKPVAKNAGVSLKPVGVSLKPFAKNAEVLLKTIAIVHLKEIAFPLHHSKWWWWWVIPE